MPNQPLAGFHVSTQGLQSSSFDQFGQYVFGGHRRVSAQDLLGLAKVSERMADIALRCVLRIGRRRLRTKSTPAVSAKTAMELSSFRRPCWAVF